MSTVSDESAVDDVQVLSEESAATTLSAESDNVATAEGSALSVDESTLDVAVEPDEEHAIDALAELDDRAVDDVPAMRDDVDVSVVPAELDDEAATDVLAEWDSSATSDVSSEQSAEELANEFSADSEGSAVSESQLELDANEDPTEPEVSLFADVADVADTAEASNVAEVSAELDAAESLEVLGEAESSAIIVEQLEQNVPDATVLSESAEEWGILDALTTPEESGVFNVPVETELTDTLESQESPEVDKAQTILEMPVTSVSMVEPESSVFADSTVGFVDNEVSADSIDVTDVTDTSELSEVSAGSGGSDSVLSEPDLANEDNQQSNSDDTKVFVSEEVDPDDFNLQVVDIDLVNLGGDTSSIDVLLGDDDSALIDLGDLPPADTATAEVTDEQVSGENPNTVTYPESVAETSAIDVSEDAATEIVEQSDDEAVIESTDIVTEKPKKKGFVKRWANRLVSWVKRFVGF